MTSKRRLVGKELLMATRGLEFRKQEKEWSEYQIEYHNLMLNKGLEMNFKKNIRDFKQKRKEFEQELNISNEVIKALTDQIRNGVEIVEDEETKGKDKIENKQEETK